MDTFSKRFKILKDYRTEHGIYVKDEEFSQIDRLYQKIMREKRHANLSEQQKESMLTGVARDILVGMTERKTFLRLSDYAHMQYYDNLMNEQADAITNALKKHGLTPDVLKNKGITHKNDVISPQDENGIAINAEKGVDDSGYPCINNMQIYLYGELIYDYRDGMEQEIVKAISAPEPEDDNDDFDELDPENYRFRKDGKPRKGNVVNVERIGDYIYSYSEYIDKYGNLRYARRNETLGRF